MYKKILRILIISSFAFLLIGAGKPASAFEVTSYEYFVRGKGFVKTETTSNGVVMGVEATSVTVP